MVHANVGSTHTFHKKEKDAEVDVALVSSALMRDFTWRVSEHYPRSGHQATLSSVKELERRVSERHKTMSNKTMELKDV